MKQIIFTTVTVIAILLFSFSIYAQSSDDKISVQEQKDIKNFVDSFTKTYVSNLDLEKAAQTFFVSNYKQQDYKSIFINNFDKSLTNEEKRKDYFTFLDFFNLVFLTKLEDTNYDLEKLADSFGSDDNDFEKFLSSPKLSPLLQKYPKAKLLFLKENFSEIKNIEEYRSVMKDYQNIVREAGNTITAKQREKYSKFITEDKAKFFKIINISECSKEECKGLPEKTKMFLCLNFPFFLLIARENNQLKVVGIAPPAD